MATATAPRNAKNPSASSKAKTTKGKRAAKAKDTAAASRVSPDTVPEVDVRADETATPSAPTKGPETTPVVKHSRQAKFQILGHSASRVCRYMGLSGLSFDDAVAAIRGLGGDMPNPKTIQVEMADGRKPDRFPAAPLTDEQKAAVDAYKGKGSPVDREALLQEHLATKARVAA